MEKNPVTPGGIVPARELLGDLLLELNRPSQALKAYEQTLATDPNSPPKCVYGAAKAAASAGDAAAAKTYYQQLVFLESHADGETPEVAEAKAYFGQQ